jgi:hypothetical protein
MLSGIDVGVMSGLRHSVCDTVVPRIAGADQGREQAPWSLTAAAFRQGRSAVDTRPFRQWRTARQLSRAVAADFGEVVEALAGKADIARRYYPVRHKTRR